MAPFISIITINYNNAAGLEKTILSVMSQTFSDVEHIVIDGNSSDGSKDIIVKYSNRLAYSISEPDGGIYNAMNKGIRAAKGRYLLFVNSGDILQNPGSLAAVVPFITGEDLVYFDLALQLPSGVIDIKTYPDLLTFLHFKDSSLPHPATFIKKELFDTIGYYNESLKIISDWAFFLIAVCKYNVRYKHIPQVFSTFYLDGISSDIGNRERILAEKKLVLRADFPAFETLYDDLEEGEKLKQNVKSSRLIKLFKAFGFLKQI
jgi:glycosyltransferase involved in cell wall biosynthesis